MPFETHMRDTAPLQHLAQPLSLDAKTGQPLRLAFQEQVGREQAREAPKLIWVGGFKSDMTSTKAEEIGAWARANGHGFLRFDYRGHGQSEGAFKDFCLSDWLADVMLMLKTHGGVAPILIGSSMGGWLSLQAALRLRKENHVGAPSGLVLIAPAVDFTETLMWPAFPDDVKAEIMETGIWHLPSQYSEEATPITRKLIEDGRNLCLFGAEINPQCPVHILHGAQDPDVPLSHSLRLIEHMPQVKLRLSTIPDGEHRLSRPQDIALLLRAIEDMLHEGGGRNRGMLL